MEGKVVSAGRWGGYCIVNKTVDMTEMEFNLAVLVGL